ncbi:MAG: metallophosphoesterase family protein [Verrucomicrobia bacterium]|nr:metallophosphoesterase family protein [Verrucomicrobiota bacterium]
MKLPSSILALVLFATTAAPAATTIVRGPYLQSATPTSMVVRWRTDATEASVVAYGTTRDKLTLLAKSEGVVAEHIVQLTDLQPATQYFYVVGAAAPKPPTGKAAEDAPVRAATSTFTTPPPVGTAKPTRVWVLGDPGTKNAVQIAVRDVYRKYTGGRPTDLWLLLGDNAYPDGTDADYQKAIFEMYPDTLRTSPLWPALGNHDAKSANSITQSGVYYDIFTLPTRAQAGGMMSGTEAYYSFDYANIHFVCLDSHDSDRSPAGAMLQWLKADLAGTQRDWIIAFFHHPTYSKGTHNSDSDTDSGGRMNDMRAIFLPVLEAGGVDLVLTGHSHVYERSPLIDGHYGKSPTFDATKHVKQKGNGRADGDGVYRKPRRRAPHVGEVSVVTGSAGHASARPVPLDHPAMIVSFNEAGSSVLDIDGLRLDLVFLNEKGEKRDWFSIVKE